MSHFIAIFLHTVFSTLLLHHCSIIKTTVKVDKRDNILRATLLKSDAALPYRHMNIVSVQR